MAEETKQVLMKKCYETLYTTANKLQVMSDKQLEALTIRQYMTLIAIDRLPENKATLNALALQMGTTKQNVKQLVKGLEAKSLVQIVQSDSDKRAVNLQLTDLGATAMQAGTEKGVELLNQLFAHFSHDELEQLDLLLNKLYAYDGIDFILKNMI